MLWSSYSSQKLGDNNQTHCPVWAHFLTCEVREEQLPIKLLLRVLLLFSLLTRLLHTSPHASQGCKDFRPEALTPDLSQQRGTLSAWER